MLLMLLMLMLLMLQEGRPWSMITTIRYSCESLAGELDTVQDK